MSAVLIGCMDKRLAKGHHKAIKDLGVANDCYMVLNAGGAAMFRVILSLRSNAKIAKASRIILTTHSDCQKVKCETTRLRNVRLNVVAARAMFPDKTIIVLNIGVDGSYYCI